MRATVHQECTCISLYPVANGASPEIGSMGWMEGKRKTKSIDVLSLVPFGSFPRNKGGETKNLKEGLYFVTSCTDMACCQRTHYFTVISCDPRPVQQ